MSARWMPVLTVVALCVATVGAASRQRPETPAASPAEAPTEPFVAWSRERPSPPARETGEATCGADGDSGIDLADFRLGPVDPQVRICFDKEVWDGNADPNAPLRDLGVIVVKRGDRTLFR